MSGSTSGIRIIFLGPAGCGKGTQAENLKKEYDSCKVSHLSTGDMLRDAVAAQTKIGLMAKEVMDRGELVNDDIILGIVEEKLLGGDCVDGFILDGFPRTVAQAEGLEKLLVKLKCKIDHVIHFNVNEKILLERICGRRVHQQSGRVYHITNKPPKVDGIDDITGEALIQRKDDNEETFKVRYESYKKQTAPLVDYYKEKQLLVDVDASKPGEVLTSELLKMFKEKK